MSYIVRPKSYLPKPAAWTVNRSTAVPAAPKPLDIITRRYEINWLDTDGAAQSKPVVAPALPIFEEAFSAFAQGALVQTSEGYVAVEDLEPGMVIQTADRGKQTLQWVGSMTIFPQNYELGLPSSQLFRIMDGGYGHDMGTPDLMVGPSARILPGVEATNSSSPLHGVGALADGNTVIGIRPVSAIRVFHIGLEAHSLIRVNGVLCESYHPGERPHMEMPAEVYGHFLGLFPHLEAIDDFGPLNHSR